MSRVLVAALCRVWLDGRQLRAPKEIRIDIAAKGVAVATVKFYDVKGSRIQMGADLAPLVHTVKAYVDKISGPIGNGVKRPLREALKRVRAKPAKSSDHLDRCTRFYLLTQRPPSMTSKQAAQLKRLVRRNTRAD